MKRLRKFFSSLGPGFISGASDDDPSGIATYSQTGAMFGFSQLWTALFSFPLMSTVQEMCGRIGLVTGMGLAGVIRKHYSKRLLYFAVSLLFIANTINIGANLGAMAAATRLLIDVPFAILVILFAAVTIFLEVFLSYKTYAKYLKYLTLSLFAYIATAFIVKVDWLDVFVGTTVPHIKFNKDYIVNIIAIFGTTISPYLFFWQANQEVEEKNAHKRLRMTGKGAPKITPKDISRLRTDTLIGMFFSNIVMWFIIITVGATLFPNGVRVIESAEQAASSLRPFAGDAAFLLFALGIIGTGLLAVPVLSGSASYAVSEMLDWKAGLDLKWKRAKGFYGVICIAILVGLIINFIGINPIQMLYYTAVINGVIAPPLLFVILKIANNKKVMGDHVNGNFSNVFGMITALLMTFLSLLLIFFLFK